MLFAVKDGRGFCFLEKFDDESEPGDEDCKREIAYNGEEVEACDDLEKDDEAGGESFGASVGKDVDDGLRSELFIHFKGDVEHFPDDAE